MLTETHYLRDITYEALLDCVARIREAEVQLIPEASAIDVDLADFCQPHKRNQYHIDRS